MIGQRDAVYGAEEWAWENLCLDLPPVAPDALQFFAQEAMRKSGWRDDSAPVFMLDVPDEHNRSGWVDGDHVIHLHPRLLRPELVLHELAHWLRPGEGHGPQFCGVYLGLVYGMLGAEAGAGLEAAYDAFGVTVDRTWCEDAAELPERPK